MLRALLPLCAAVVCTRNANPRALPPATLAVAGAPARRRRRRTIEPTRAAALERARELAGPDGVVLATGSIYLVADLLRDRRAARGSTL